MDTDGHFKTHHPAVRPSNRAIDATDPVPCFPVLKFPDVSLAEIFTKDPMIAAEFARRFQPLKNPVALLPYDIFPEQTLFRGICVKNFIGFRIRNIDLLINPIENRNELLPRLIERFS
jgi:hypothetical protein